MPTDPKYAPGQVVDGKTICGARKKNDDPCGAPPPKGGVRCVRHGGSSRQAIAKARERNIEAEARIVLGKIDPTAPKEHPIEMILNIIQAKYAEVMWLRSIVQDFTEQQLTWGRTEHRTGVGPEGMVDIETFKAEQNIWWKLLREAENQLVNWNAMALKAGVEEREVRLKEDQALKVVGVIEVILNDMLGAIGELIADGNHEAFEIIRERWKELIQRIVPRALRALGDA